MATVLKFPTKKKLPQELEEDLYEVGKAYLIVLHKALSALSGDEPTDAEFDEIRDLVVMAYAEGLAKALAELEEGE